MGKDLQDMDEGSKNKRKLEKIKSILVQQNKYLKKDLMWIEDVADHQEEEVEVEKLKLFSLYVE